MPILRGRHQGTGVGNIPTAVVVSAAIGVGSGGAVRLAQAAASEASETSETTKGAREVWFGMFATAEGSSRTPEVKGSAKNARMSRVLHIEDDPRNRLLVRKLLTADGHDVIDAADGL